jgi:hypothetical protein
VCLDRCLDFLFDVSQVEGRWRLHRRQKVSRIDHSLLISGCDLDLLAGWRDPPR